MPFAQDPFGGAAETVAPAAQAAGDQLVSAACQHITKELCEKANTGLLATSAGYVLVCVALFTIVRMWMARRGMSTIAGRVVINCVLAAGVAGALAGLDPIRGQDVTCCLASATFKAHVFLQDSTAGRAVVFGALPAALLFLIVYGVEKLMKR